jgi:hypothetical protein
MDDGCHRPFCSMDGRATSRICSGRNLQAIPHNPGSARRGRRGKRWMDDRATWYVPLPLVLWSSRNIAVQHGQCPEHTAPERLFILLYTSLYITLLTALSLHFHYHYHDTTIPSLLPSARRTVTSTKLAEDPSHSPSFSFLLLPSHVLTAPHRDLSSDPPLPPALPSAVLSCRP